MNTRMMFARGVAEWFLDRIYMIDRIKKGMENVANVEMLPIPNPISNWELATLELATLAHWQH